MFLIFILYFHVKKEEKYQIHSPKKSQHKKKLIDWEQIAFKKYVQSFIHFWYSKSD